MTGTVAPIHFDHLTWPEVAALPRDLPILLPLGAGFSPVEIYARLDAPQCALLPPFPFGWPGSLLPVPQPIFKQVLINLFAGLQEDGFQKLFLLSDNKLDFELAGIQTLRLKPTRSNAPALDFGPGRVVLIPTGHTEQHGHHLPLNTDTEIISAIADGVRQAISDIVTLLPVLPYGVSTHRRAFAGTFNLGGRAYEDFLLAIIDHLVAQGADCFYLLNGHGGNHSFLVNVVKFAGEKHTQAFTATAWLHTSGAHGAAALERLRLSARGGMGHAGELETAFMLHLRLELVHMERVVDETDFIASDIYYMDWIEGGELIANPPWEDDTRTGSYGAGSVATAEHGRQWLEAAIQEKIAHVHAVRDQHERRCARRLKR
jgi:creatinine amidohydrolase